MRKRVIAGLLAATTLAMGTMVAINMNDSNVSKASKVENTMNAVDEMENIDVALVNNQAEEKYIVGLVGTRTNQILELSDWEICLDYLEANYDALMADETVDTLKVESYVTGYQLVRQANAEEATAAVEETGAPEETGANPGLANYDVSKVQEYIQENWERYNPDYPNYPSYGGDCANFVSQCLHAGGMQMVGSNASNFSNWFCRTNVTEQFSKVSSTWRGAEAFCSYWTKNCMDYQDFDRTYFEDRLAFNPVYRWANPGDAMTFFNANGRPYHTTIVNLKNRDGDRDIRFAAHSSYQWEKSLYEYINNSSMSKVRIYKMSNPTAEQEASYDYDMENIEIEIVDSLAPSQEEESGRFWRSIFGR